MVPWFDVSISGLVGIRTVSTSLHDFDAIDTEDSAKSELGVSRVVLQRFRIVKRKEFERLTLNLQKHVYLDFLGIVVH